MKSAPLLPRGASRLTRFDMPNDSDAKDLPLFPFTRDHQLELPSEYQEVSGGCPVPVRLWNEQRAWLIGSHEPLVFKKGGIARIDVKSMPPDQNGTLVWHATPRMLRGLV